MRSRNDHTNALVPTAHALAGLPSKLLQPSDNLPTPAAPPRFRRIATPAASRPKSAMKVACRGYPRFAPWLEAMLVAFVGSNSAPQGQRYQTHAAASSPAQATKKPPCRPIVCAPTIPAARLPYSPSQPKAHSAAMPAGLACQQRGSNAKQQVDYCALVAMPRPEARPHQRQKAAQKTTASGWTVE